MSKQNIGKANKITPAILSDNLMVEIDGKLKRLPLEEVLKIVIGYQEGSHEVLSQIAWGVPIDQNASSAEWGVIGNREKWEEYKQKVGRYLVTGDGKAAKLDPDDSSVFADGSPLDEEKGNIMVIAPRLYYKVQKDPKTDIEYLWMSTLPIGGHYIGDADDDKYVCIGAYEAVRGRGWYYIEEEGGYDCEDYDIIGSYSMDNGTPFYIGGYKDDKLDFIWDFAQKNGKEWGLVNYDHRRFMLMLCLSEFGSPDAHIHIGYGPAGDIETMPFSATQRYHVINYALRDGVGVTKCLGDHTGKVEITLPSSFEEYHDCCHVSLFGIENSWGTTAELTQGIYCGASQNTEQTGNEVFIYKGNHWPTEEEIATHPNGEYRQLTREAIISNDEGYNGIYNGGVMVKLELGDHFDIIPTEIKPYDSDNWGYPTTIWNRRCAFSKYGQVVTFGGEEKKIINGLITIESLFLFTDDEINNKGWSHLSSCHTRIAYYGNLEFMTGAELNALTADNGEATPGELEEEEAST